jgi:MYXO-CTERM domain-containing protein
MITGTTAARAALALALFVLPGDALADGPCDDIDFWSRFEPINPYMVPTDGVLLFSVVGYLGTEGSDADALARMTVTVTLDDVTIAGKLETTDIGWTIAWRPDAPLVPGGYYVVDARLDNPAESDAEACAPDTLGSLFTMIVEQDPAAPLTPPTLVTNVELRDLELNDLGSLVCCDGARPVDPPEQGSASGSVYWTEGHCASSRGLSYLDVAVDVEHALPPATAGLVALRFIEDGEPGGFMLGLDERRWIMRTQAFCHRVEFKNLATGATAISEQVCHGEDTVDLGPHAIDVTAELAEHCRGPAQTCEVVDVVETRQTVATWDLERCTPWGTEEDAVTEDAVPGDEGCGCTSSPGGALGWLVLLASCRRRRRA